MSDTEAVRGIPIPPGKTEAKVLSARLGEG